MEFEDDLRPVVLLHESHVRKRVDVVPSITSRAHGVAIHEVEPDRQIPAGVEVGALEVAAAAAGDAAAVAAADDDGGEPVEFRDEPAARAGLGRLRVKG